MRPRNTVFAETLGKVGAAIRSAHLKYPCVRLVALTLLAAAACSEGSGAGTGGGASVEPASGGAGAGGSAGAAGSFVGTVGGASSAGSAGMVPVTSAGAGAGSASGGTAPGVGGGDVGNSAAGAGGDGDEPGPAALIGFDWGKAVIDTRLAARGFDGSYQDGLALHGIYLAYRRLKDPVYLNVLTKAADGYGAPAGRSLDEIMHMAAVADAYELTMKQGYVAPAQTTRHRFDDYPMADGVFWHANNGSRDHQLWADGTFMSLAFLTRYGSVFDDSSVWAIAATQLTHSAKHLLNPATGILWHAWDESGTVSWSHHPSRTNEIHWGRGMGWFAVASAMTLEALPANDPGRPAVEQQLKALVEALAKYQDPATGRWYQVVNLPDDPRNWLETSCSSMFSYATWWAYKHHLVDASYAEVAKKGLLGVLQRVKKDANDRTTIQQTCTGLNASDDLVGNYFNHGRADNDAHGIGAFILMWEGMQ